MNAAATRRSTIEIPEVVAGLAVDAMSFLRTQPDVIDEAVEDGFATARPDGDLMTLVDEATAKAARALVEAAYYRDLLRRREVAGPTAGTDDRGTIRRRTPGSDGWAR